MHHTLKRTRLWGADTLFSARYVVDAKRGAILLEAGPADCEAGERGVVDYHQGRIDTMSSAQPPTPADSLRMLRTARLSRGRADAAQVKAICRGAGDYFPARDDHLVRA